MKICCGKTFKACRKTLCVNNGTISTSEQKLELEKILFNHICSTLSELDMEILQSVPSGGNWKDIPEATIAKSARLTQIKNSGGRTTYYGRLDGNLPSYTVNTYFNRPGNGSFIHPMQDRLISQREAARLQSFPDSYRFLGSFSSRFKQIGNAVPPLLARAVSDRIRKKGLSVDVFCGAGGLSEGLQATGHRIVLASDFNAHMCETYRYNHPHTLTKQLDLSSIEGIIELIHIIETELHGRTLNLLAGGPPCQGFSTAGKWNHTDSRNSLVFKMIELIHTLQPENVILENVPGIRWMQHGRVLESLLDSFEKEGYRTRAFLLHAEEYGVPQRRKRVFILANRNNEVIEKPDSCFARIVSRKTRESAQPEENGLSHPISVFEAISDLPKISSGGGSDVMDYNSSWTTSDYQCFMRGMIPFEELVKRRKANKVD
ncbi:MAG: DNA cytosine methyltransferase [Candidatus Thorarchaeota archaeon]|nr:DNA cytosine methyltransferase [Candidatus Thorarchaeota archaeon]